MPLGKAHAWKPIHGTRLDPTNSLAQGLVMCWPFWEGAGGAREIVSGLAPITNTTLTWGGSTSGTAGVFSGTNLQYSNQLATGTAVTAIVVASLNAISGNQMLICRTPVNTKWQLFFQGSPLQLTWCGASASLRAVWAISGVSANQVAVWGASDTGSLATLYVNGASVATGTGGAGPAAATTNIYLGTYNGVAYPFAGKMALTCVWNRVLSAAEHAAFAANPWQIFAPHAYYSLLKSAAVTTFMPWIYGDQIEANAQG